MEYKKFRDLAELGEFGLIDKLTEDFQLKNKNSILITPDNIFISNFLYLTFF